MISASTGESRCDGSWAPTHHLGRATRRTPPGSAPRFPARCAAKQCWSRCSQTNAPAVCPGRFQAVQMYCVRSGLIESACEVDHHGRDVCTDHAPDVAPTPGEPPYATAKVESLSIRNWRLELCESLVCSAISRSPLFMNSCSVQRPPRLSGKDKTAHRGSDEACRSQNATSAVEEVVGHSYGTRNVCRRV